MYGNELKWRSPFSTYAYHKVTASHISDLYNDYKLYVGNVEIIIKAHS